MADDLPTFDIQTPTGHVLTIQAPDQETALAGARQWHDDNSSLWGNIKGAVTSIPAGLEKGFADYASKTGQAAQIEMGQPLADAQASATGQPQNNMVPDSGTVLKNLQQNITGVLPVAPNFGGQVGNRAGQMLAYDPTGPLSLGRAITASLASGAGAETGKQLAGGTPYQGAAELAGGMLGPYAATKAAEVGAKATGQLVGGMASGAGKNTLRDAFTTGVEGGDRAAAFTGNMRGTIPPEAMASEAQGAVNNLYRARSANYQAAADNVLNKSQAVVGFDDIDKALADSARIGTFQGVSTNPSTDATRTLVQRTVDYWKGLGQQNPQFTTPAGMVGLKQRIGDIRDNLDKFSPQWKVADEAYQSVASSIENKVPEYAAMTKQYARDSQEAANLTKTFSLGENNTPDTAVRKLQSISRDGANTNYGARANLAKVLEASGAPNLGAAVAGQASNSWLPRGLPRMVAEGGVMGAVGLGLSPQALLASPLTSPRLTGEAAHALGRAAGWANVPQAFQALQTKQQAAKNLALLLAAKGNQ
jgi:hypothetical protein